jgi:hypothetical protein
MRIIKTKQDIVILRRVGTLPVVLLVRSRTTSSYKALN